MKTPLVSFVEEAGFARLTLERPDAGNAITPELIYDLDAALVRAASSGAGAVLLGASGRNFCVGADLKYFAGRPDSIARDLGEMADAFHAALLRLTELPIPVVARVQGEAVGAGFGLMLAADHVVCAQDTRLSTGYARLGLSADAGVSLFLTRALGPRLARNLLMTSRFITGPEALALGLADECGARSDLDLLADQAARSFAHGPGAAFAAIKRLTAEAAGAPSLRAHLDRERDEIVRLAESGALASALAAKTPVGGEATKTKC